MTALKFITAEAKKIRKQYPKKEWKECIAQASAIYAKKHKGKSKVGAVKKTAKKKVAKKKTAKKSSNYHKDTKSHNVNIKVVSGVRKKIGKIITYNDGYKFKIVTKNYTLKNWNKKNIYGLDINSQSESLIESKSDINNFDIFGIEIGFEKNNNMGKISGWKKGKTKFVEKGEKPPKKNGVRVTRKKGEFSKFRSISGVPGSTGVKRLTQVVKNGTPLEKKVASIIKSKYTGSGYDNLEGLFKEILYNGLQSGIISELIYYSDTLAFYKRYKKNIQALLSNTMNDLGEYNPANIFGKNWDTEDPLAQDTTNQNLLAWFGFEETARDIAYRLGYEL